jgi:hypothetical protein
MEWNRIEQKPNNMETLWVWMPKFMGNEQVQMGTYDNGRYFDVNGREITKRVIAWQPINKPRPPL